MLFVRLNHLNLQKNKKGKEIMKEKQAAGHIAEDIGTKAYYALLEEAYTTPKPGLVDLYSCGDHDVFYNSLCRCISGCYGEHGNHEQHGYCTGRICTDVYGQIPSDHHWSACSATDTDV